MAWMKSDSPDESKKNLDNLGRLFAWLNSSGPRILQENSIAVLVIFL